MNDWIVRFGFLAFGFFVGYWMRSTKREETVTGLSFSDRALKNLKDTNKPR